MDTKNDPAENGLVSSHGVLPVADQAQGKTDELLFYNVMPQNNRGGGVIDPTVKVVSPSDMGEVKPSSAGDFFGKYKKYILIALGVIILGGAGYFVLNKYLLKPYEEESLINPEAGKIKSNEAAPTPAGQTASSSVTTSAEWQIKYWGSATCTTFTVCGDDADPDLDGFTNLEEFKTTTDPNHADSDNDGLADGDEVHVFSSLPLDAHTAKDPKYNDADYIKGEYSFTTSKKMSPAEVTNISKKMNELHLHQPTLTTLKDVLVSQYNFGANAEPSPTPTQASASTTLDQSIEAKTDRDAQRSATIKKIESALVQYKNDNKTYPQASDFTTMYAKIKPYMKIASNPNDPINKDPYVYGYTVNSDGSDFTLSFFSEVAGQIIKKHAADAVKDSSAEQAGIYDDQRMNDLQMLQSALLLYSNNNVAGNQDYVFPTKEKYKTSLVPQYIGQIPKDPKTGADYDYQVSGTFDTFTLKTVLENPSGGTTGYLCNQEECNNY